jgi:phosphoribosylformimino-5-aminoimidazole carboxamide ribotide isomerase
VLSPWPSTFTVYPAIDLRGGRVVRLRQGDVTREQIYSEDPVAVLMRFAEAGARWVHVVDLDGAITGGRRQGPAIAAILVQAAAASAEPAEGIRVQVAGGLRDRVAIDAVLDTGAARVVVGTTALEDSALVARAIATHGPDRIAIALDVRDGVAVGHGWVPGAPGVRVKEALARLIEVGATTFVVTAIDRDGLLGGPDLDLLARMVDACRMAAANGAIPAPQVIASGGISAVADLGALRSLGCSGAIIGRAIYDGTIDLAEAVRVSGRPSSPSGRPRRRPTSR